MGKSLKAEAFILAWNESETIQMTIDYYLSICDRVTLFDNYSDDGTPDLAARSGAIVKPFGIPGVLDDREYTKLKNNCWKGSTAEWVYVVDADEIVNRFDREEEKARGTTILRTYGWQVFSRGIPHFESRNVLGFHDPNYSKLCCFRPDQIKEINYVHGCHIAKPVGNAKMSVTQTTLFHFRNIGGPDRLVRRHADYRARLSDWNKRWNAGVHYTHDDDRRIREWEEQFQKSGPWSPPGTWSPGVETTN